MHDELKALSITVSDRLSHIKTLVELDDLELTVFGRKQGQLMELLKKLKDLSVEEKKTVGQLANEVKIKLETAFADKRTQLEPIELRPS